MEFKIELPIKPGDKVYTLGDFKIEQWWVTKIEFKQAPRNPEWVSMDIVVTVDRYKEPENSCVREFPLAFCFTSREELIAQL